MDKKEKMDRIDIYMFLLMGIFYLYIYGKNVILAAQSVNTGFEWFLFIVQAVIALLVCLLAFILSYVFAYKAIKYFGLPKNYVWATILAIVMAPLSIIILLFVLSGLIPSIFDPHFL